jgi:ATP-binding cassette, subfamily F, member 3
VLLNVTNLHKSIGLKDLFENLSFMIEEGEKVALIGRNGLGKSTLFKMLTGEDTEFQGNLEFRKNARVILTRQEHFLHHDITPLEYILEDVPEYRELQAAIRDYEESQTADMDKIQIYTDAVMRFSELDYYTVEDRIIESLHDLEIEIDRAMAPMATLSGGEKRFVELVRVMYSGADIALIDEPTNHMDYVGKAAFVKWLQETNQTIFVVTHDRDVLNEVDRILELKDKKIYEFNGNYDSYLRQNAEGTAIAVRDYESSLKKVDQLNKKIMKQGITKEETIRKKRFQRELDRISGVEKPSFWIDEDSIQSVDKGVLEKYEKYKEKNIVVSKSGSGEAHKKLLMKATGLSIGYETPLFSGLNFELYNYDRIFIRGRNGAGKSTLVKTLIKLMLEQLSAEAVANGKRKKPDGEYSKVVSKVFNGDYKFSPSIKLGVYEQEVNQKYLNMSLSDAIFTVYNEQDLPVSAQRVKDLMGQYLFDPQLDADLTFKNLSGGQKARFQIIKMLSNNPNLLILDEPTNHLDLPSIEELERSLSSFTGAIMYITHDTYLVEKLGGKVIEI